MGRRASYVAPVLPSDCYGDLLGLLSKEGISLSEIKQINFLLSGDRSSLLTVRECRALIRPLIRNSLIALGRSGLEEEFHLPWKLEVAVHDQEVAWYVWRSIATVVAEILCPQTGPVNSETLHKEADLILSRWHDGGHVQIVAIGGPVVCLPLVSFEHRNLRVTGFHLQPIRQTPKVERYAIHATALEPEYLQEVVVGLFAAFSRGERIHPISHLAVPGSV